MPTAPKLRGGLLFGSEAGHVRIIRRMLVRLIRVLPKARRWVSDTIAAHSQSAVPVASLGFPRLPDAFPAAMLNQVRAVVVDRMPRPPLEDWGLHAADDFGFIEAAGLTLADLIFVRRGCEHDESLYFHELIHIVQWRVLGRSRFLALYGLMLLEQGYADSPLETMAYGMQRSFDAGSWQGDAAVIAARRTEELFENFRRRSLLHRFAFTLVR